MIMADTGNAISAALASLLSFGERLRYCEFTSLTSADPLLEMRQSLLDRSTAACRLRSSLNGRNNQTVLLPVVRLECVHSGRTVAMLETVSWIVNVESQKRLAHSCTGR